MPSKDMRPAVIGLYGLPGCGKSFLLNELKKHLSHSEYAFFEGSDVISSIVPGGLSTFQELEEEQKQLWRGFAIDKIVSECQDSAKTAVVAGHFMFWSQGELATVWTPKDKTAYTHIMYLDVPEGIIAKQRLDDVHRHRAEIPLAELARWQQAEIDQLSHLCQRHGILFSRLPERSRSHIATVLKLIQFSSLVITEANATRVDAKVNNFLADHAELETVVVVDADKTLSSEDTGVVFWQSLDLRRPPLDALKAQDCPLSDLFSGPLGYSEAAFLQATLLYEEAANEEDFERICDIVASKTKMYAEFVSLFRSIACHDYVRVLVVTCGIRRVWEKILHREGFSRTIQVIGGSRISDGVIVTADAKAQEKKKNERVKEVVKQVYDAVGSFVNSERKEEFKSKLEDLCNRTCDGWMQIQHLEERVRPSFSPNYINVWKPLPGSSSSRRTETTTSTPSPASSTAASTSQKKPEEGQPRRQEVGKVIWPDGQPRRQEVGKVIWPSFLYQHPEDPDEGLLHHGYVLTDAQTAEAEKEGESSRRLARRNTRNNEQIGTKKRRDSGIFLSKGGSDRSGIA
ncbi:uracil phosphoribosyltransferase [Metarhizium robertsii ARSEF 23]|uniref:Uracil phosphoribosyltransferase n=1 Tax=Metarhizium robertsii (strain ARSEF 23 / ATCC MYA-3075) TaxID=655844 RepID=E9FA11_METRA|nr:uracil phosphoribosyltransferase [Metarhizium robertsii ARSEF 23]EFY95409.1 uracil phosphoribosyltransferase [Metarhizium robertsii ARSEF 23]